MPAQKSDLDHMKAMGVPDADAQAAHDFAKANGLNLGSLIGTFIKILPQIKELLALLQGVGGAGGVPASAPKNP